jgi:NADPH-dependent ferric siderophore reductase
MTAPEQQARPQRPRPQLRTVRVCRVERITPHMVRVVFTGDDLAGFQPQVPGHHLKLFLPAPGQDQLFLPTFGPNGAEYPEGQERPTVRTYTPRRFDAERLELEIDFVLHGTGPASTWAEHAKPGDPAAVAGPGGGYRASLEADWYLIAGDESALPAIGTILDALPATARAQVYLEIGDAHDEQPLVSAAKLEVTWLHRRGERAPGELLESAIRAAQLQPGDGQVFVACEAGVVRRIRKHLIEERGLDRASVHTRGYWKRGEANHPDHDMGEDA